MAGVEKIGEWSTTELTKFINTILQSSDFLQTANRVYEELTVTRKVQVSDELQFYQSQTTVGAAGSAAALPATPKGYFKLLDATGSVVLVPYYAVP